MILGLAMEYPTQEEIQAPTYSEIDAICDGMTDVEREIFRDAASILYFMKSHYGDRTPWRELIRLYRLGGPKKVELEVVDLDGNLLAQSCYVDQCDGLTGVAEKMRDSIRSLSKALEQIENFDPKRHINLTVS